MKEGMKNLKDSITNKIYCLIVAEVLARNIFMSKPVTRLFPCWGISRSIYLFHLIFSNFSRSLGGLPLLYLIHITLEGFQSLFSFVAWKADKGAGRGFLYDVLVGKEMCAMGSVHDSQVIQRDIINWTLNVGSRSAVVCTVRELGISKQRLDCGFQIRIGRRQGSGWLWSWALKKGAGRWLVWLRSQECYGKWMYHMGVQEEPAWWSGRGCLPACLPAGSVLRLRFVFGVCF